MIKPSPPVGATLIVAGTTIGAGMLALPMISHGLGFGVMAAFMLITWGMMAVAALLILEVNLTIKPGCSLFVMATETLQNKGKFLAIGSMLFLFYALLAAYIAGGGSQLGQYIPEHSELPIGQNSQGMLLFTLLFGTMASAGVRYVDICNRLLFLFMLGAFVIVLGILSPEVRPSQLISLPENKWLGITVLPVVFTSFGYHGGIPSLIAYVGPNRQLLKRIFLLGSFLPLLVYLLWLATALGQLDANQLAMIADDGSVTALVTALTESSHSSFLESFIHIFTDLALITSFLGVALGLFDFMHSALNSSSRVKTAIAVYIPPLIIASLIPGAFVVALNFAALALAVLAIILPALMLLELRKRGLVSKSATGILFWPTVLFGVAICLLTLFYS
ncbi:hypothetical protein M3P05_11340 [Sansalvadorimonas sp. 2012CJ34-2]|uniref:Tyrosine-specific transport protein n=1 Tax=Parendozoicomonas callyspongiae TaxID=2942213 RepID=A0ABT0PGY2_9GAMM|nr:aromatic amino acid transport family protein [Sansalvadorimonas sp. 2012CJ34-2]MCL6270516.1 hypothetical protein [Sansalvadorimonas sp. 2012CJ34-2]